MVEAWGIYGLPGAPPPVDFKRNEILFVATRETTICGIRAIVTAEVTVDGALILRVPVGNAYMCPLLEATLYMYANVEPVPPLVIRVIQVPRNAVRHVNVSFGSAQTP